MCRDRCVGTPRNVPDPNWANVWCLPSGSTTLCAAWAPPLKRTTAWTGSRELAWEPSREHSQSTTVPLPASP
jgi:hypothetical protein